MRDILEPPDELLASIFPWLEEEECALKNRCDTLGKKAHDHALLSLLGALRFFRRVILQDSAVLYSKYPDLALFKYAPFTSPTFIEFSMNATFAIQTAEESARQDLDRLPETMASSFRGILASTSLHQGIVQQAFQNTHTKISSDLVLIKTMVEASLLNGSSAKKRKAIDTVLKKISESSTASESGASTAHKSKRHKPDPNPMDLAITAPADALPHVSSLLNPSLEPSPDLGPGDNIPSPVLAPYVSSSGSIYPPSTFQFAGANELRNIQQASVQKLEDLFSYERVVKHTFAWDDKNEDWLPNFEHFWRPKGRDLTIDDIWKEDRFGIDGMFSIQELTARWGARWKRNEPRLKTEAGRRKKIIQLIDDLSGKVNWNAELALRFLREKYPIDSKSAVAHLRTSRSFMDYLNGKTRKLILEASISYP